MKHLSGEYALIKDFYGTKTAKRSGVPLINHIDEGIDLLRGMGAAELSIRAFCLHPLAQGGDDGWTIMLHNVRMKNIQQHSVALAQQYSYAANIYLCRPATDHYTMKDLAREVGPLNQHLIHMLAADKLQNEKDFELYHKATHPRSKQLAHYFNLWLDYLDYCEDVLNKKRRA